MSVPVLLLAVGVLLIPASSSQSGGDIVSYQSRPQEELPCYYNGTERQVIWLDQDTGDNIYELIVGVDSAPVATSSNSKHANFDTDFVEGSEINVIINGVQREDASNYVCTKSIVGNSTSVSYSLFVEVSVTPSISVGSGPVKDELLVILGNSYTLTCSAVGASSVNPLQLTIVGLGNDGPGTTSQENQDDPTLTDYTNTVTFTPIDKNLETLECLIDGYGQVTENENIVSRVVDVVVQYVPECTLFVNTIDRDCRNVQMICICDAVPDESICSFFQDSSFLADTGWCNWAATVTFNTTTEYSCRATNDVGLGSQSEPVRHECFQECDPYFFGDDCSQSCDCSPEGSTGCSHVDGRCFCSPGYIGDSCEEAPTSTPPATCSPTTEYTCACTGPIAGLVVESVIIAMLLGIVVWFIFNITRDLTKHDRGGQEEGHPENDNSAYMDLHERNTSANGEPTLIEVPATNVKNIDQLPGSGLMIYSKAILTTSSGNEEAVVKSTSEEAPIKVEKIWSAEIEALQSLPKEVNLVQTLGWCDSLPKLLLFEYINGTNLVTHLTENFSMHKVHQYGNTRRERFEVPETGRVENLPRYAIDVARGLKFLLAKEFIHPGIRARKVLVDLSGKCKIYDFVSVDKAKEITSLLWKESTPYKWMPPEFLLLDTVAPPGDVWSFGVLMWEIYSYGSQPYPGKDRSEVESSLRKKERLAMPNNCPGAIWQLINRCWDQSVDTRLKIQEIASNLAAMCNDDKDYDVIPRGGIGNDRV